MQGVAAEGRRPQARDLVEVGRPTTALEDGGVSRTVDEPGLAAFGTQACPFGTDRLSPVHPPFTFLSMDPATGSG